MEVHRQSFQGLLPAILNAISNAHFVSIDLELSGVFTRSHDMLDFTTFRLPLQTLQERYMQVKEAAEKYQILQVGLTFIKEDVERGVYIARPYNFNISPLFEDKLKIEREFAFHTSSISFLNRYNFSFDTCLNNGILYLSRQEEATYRQRVYARQNRPLEDIPLGENDTQSLAFVERVRQEIKGWQNKPSAYALDLEIAPSNHWLDPTNCRPFNTFEKRLVHQLVRREFPGLVSFSRDKCIGVARYNSFKEEAAARVKQKCLDEQLSRQIGFRWIVEAMTRGNLSGMDYDSLARGKMGESIFVDKEALSREMNRIKSLLMNRPTVLVGHNLFTDLVYLHRTFLGPLPDMVEDFQRDMHKLFPTIIDTKYLETHGKDRAQMNSSLVDLDRRLRNQIVPAIETHHDHQRYDHEELPHEAGYDSFVTAKALIRLSRNLEAASEGRQEGSASKMMPPFESGFWAVYGNKLRVYGTKEEVCELGALESSIGLSKFPGL